MSCSIKIQTFDGKSCWKTTLTQEEHRHFRGICESRRTILVFPAALIPVRSNTLSNFCKDFFFPTTINQVVRIRNIGVRIFVALISMIFDLATLPIRCITCIPTVIYNRTRRKHPLHSYLIGKIDSNSPILQSEKLYVKQSWQTTSKRIGADQADDNPKPNVVIKHIQGGYVNLINVPFYPDFDESCDHKQIVNEEKVDGN